MMQDVAWQARAARDRIDQSCRVCASGMSGGRQHVEGKWSSAYLWLEVETRLRAVAKSTDVEWNCNEQRHILNLMWHYAQAVYFEEEKK